MTLVHLKNFIQTKIEQYTVLSAVVPFEELEVQQHTLQEGSRGLSFCGPNTEEHTNLDCISVPHQKIQDLHNNGRKMLRRNHFPLLAQTADIQTSLSQC